MKQFFMSVLVITLLLVFSAFTPQKKSSGVNFEDDRIEVSFDSKITFNDLVKIKLQLSDHGITIFYKEIAFDEAGGLSSLFFKVDCNDGYSGASKMDNIEEETRWGFYRDYAEDAISDFGAGNLD